MTLSRGNDINLSASLTQHGEAFQLVNGPCTPPKKPPGVYVCAECGDAQITWRSPVDEFKTRCPKCNVQMSRVAKILPVAPI